MRKSNETSDDSRCNILKIHPKENGEYEVYFKFLPIPVKMNKDYLNTIIEDANMHNYDSHMA